MFNRITLLAMAITVLSGCASKVDLQQRAVMAGMQSIVFGPETHPVAGMIQPGILASEQLRIYIEGDGRAYITATQPSTDPTPDDSLVVQLASQDQEGAVYLARPCQFITGPSCSVKDWTSERFSRANLDAMSTALDDIKEMTGARDLELVGYSGGGAMALLLAAHRDDVVAVQTIAGTLDHEAWVSIKQLTPLRHSLNAADYSSRLRTIPQRHFVGRNDKVVPPEVADAYLKKVRPTCYELIVSDADHRNGFNPEWLRLKDRPIHCAKPTDRN